MRSGPKEGRGTGSQSVRHFGGRLRNDIIRVRQRVFWPMRARLSDLANHRVNRWPGPASERALGFAVGKRHWIAVAPVAPNMTPFREETAIGRKTAIAASHLTPKTTERQKNAAHRQIQ